MAKIKNLKKASKRILKAIKQQERIILFSDCDLDGVTSLIIIEETIKNLGGKISSVCFANRDVEGYGLSKNSLKFFKRYSPALLILMDCGIGNFKEIELAQKMGFEVIIIDHHLIPDKIPKAEIIVDPKQKGDRCSFKFLAACGICFKLAQEMFKDKIPKSIEKSFLELTLLGTIFDKVPQEQDNKIFIEKGLKYLPFTLRPGLKIFFKKFNRERYSLEEIVQNMIWILNITDVKDHLTESYQFLTLSDEKQIEQLFERISEKSLKRREVILDFVSRVEEKISPNTRFVFEIEKDIPLGLEGAIASWLLAKFQIPVFIINIKDNKIKGSARAPKSIDTVEISKQCSICLKTYGGHSAASGFTIKKGKLEKFRRCVEGCLAKFS